MVLTRRTDTPRDERGAVAVVVAVLLTVLCIVGALVVDLGLAYDTRRSSQNSADASALAGANVLYPQSGTCATPQAGACVTDAVNAVKSYAAANFGVTAAEWLGCSAAMPSGYASAGSGTSCITFNRNGSNPTKVLVTMPTRSVRTSFAGVIGKQTIPVASRAEAEVGSEVKCTLCFLGDVDTENADFSVYGGSIAVNGDVTAGPNSYWTSNSNGIVGSVSGGVFTPPPSPIAPFTDPLASLSLPLSDPSLTVKSTGTPCTRGPGIYPNAISLGNNVTCTLLPGLYVIEDTWGIGNRTLVTGVGVTIYVPSTGMLDFKNGDVNLVAPVVGPFKDLGIVYSRDNTHPFTIQGNGLTGVTGTVYMRSANLAFNGNSCFVFTGGPVVAAGVDMANGNRSCVDINAARDTLVSRTQMHLSQ